VGALAALVVGLISALHDESPGPSEIAAEL